MKGKILLALLVMGVSGAFAGPASAEATRTVEWYLAPENEQALNAKIEECRNNPGELRDTPNCVNARQAVQKKATSKRFKKVEEPAIPTF